MALQEQVKLHYDALNETEKEMISYLMDHLDELCGLSITDIARMLQSSRSSVLRLAQKLGYRGYSQLKYEMQNAVQTREVIPDNLVASFRHEVERTFELAEQVNFLPLVQAMSQAQNLILYATGFVQSNYLKQLSSELFMYGRPNFKVNGESNFEIIARSLTSKDLVIIASYSGNTPGILQTINLLSVRKVPICSVTVLSNNKLTEASRYSLFYETSELAGIEGGISMNSLGIILTILSRKYLEYTFYDEV